MTQLLEKAFEQANKLPETEQNALGRWLIEEIISEKKWQKSFAESESLLGQLADEALEEYDKGETTPLLLPKGKTAAIAKCKTLEMVKHISLPYYRLV